MLSTWARDFMGTKVVGNINVALVFGLLQFVSTFLIAWLYAPLRDRKLDPLAERARAALRREEGRDTMSTQALTTDPVPRRRR